MSSKTPAELIALDAKEFGMGSAKVEVAQVNVVDTLDVLARKEAVGAEMRKAIEEKDLDLFVLVVTDILTNNSTALALGKYASHVEKAFNVTLVENLAVLEGVVSRKKQIVPVLIETFSS